MKKIKIFIYFFLLFLLLLPSPAHAYLDPGTGSYFFQLLIAGLLGSTFFLKSGIKKIRGFFKGKAQNKTKPRDDK
ncbi:hypothetical protein HY357_01765 [Candidatus Roizmanbacteria bacterium]|nr:hypothetical protein [Candidatus Roizmanbacteria bacterium]